MPLYIFSHNNIVKRKQEPHGRRKLVLDDGYTLLINNNVVYAAPFIILGYLNHCSIEFCIK